MGMSVAVLAMLGSVIASAGDPPPEGPGATLSITQEGDSVWIRDGGNPLLRYRFQDIAYKPYVQEWYSPDGVQVLRDSPADHLHHHALMFAINVDGVNFWEEHEAPGAQVHQDIEATEIGPGRDPAGARIVHRLHWANPRTEAVLLHERRTITVYETPAPSLLTWESRFALPPGKEKATLGGAHYHGLGMRFRESMDTVGTFTTPAGELGEHVRGDEHLTPGAWCAYTAPADGQTVTVALFDHPDNVRPVRWFTMKESFAYLSATINLWREPLEVKPGKPLILRYGAALWDGAVSKEGIKDAYKQWLATTAVR